MAAARAVFCSKRQVRDFILFSSLE